MQYPDVDALLALKLKRNDLLRRLDDEGTGKDRKLLQQDLDQVEQSIARHEERRRICTAEYDASKREARVLDLAAVLFTRRCIDGPSGAVEATAEDCIRDAETFMKEWDRRRTT